MEIKEIKEKSLWENFLKGKEKTFLQSWQWGNFQRNLGEKIFRLGVSEKEKLKAVCLAIKIKAKRGNFLFVPHGPIFDQEEEKFKILPFLISFLKNLSVKEKACFLRIAPILARSRENENLFRKLSFREAPIHIHPELTWEIDISRSEEEIFSSFRKTHRNLIRRAIKEGVKIEVSKEIEAVEIFNNLYQQTAQRHHFVPFSKEFLEKEFLSFKEDNSLLVFLGKYQGKVISSAMIIFYDQTAYYHQGASLEGKIPSSYLLQWEVIKESKKRNCQKYNMWGIAPIKNERIKEVLNSPERKFNPYNYLEKNHPWFGLSLFKTGFGGKPKFYLRTQDLIISKFYWLNWLVEKIRKKKRRL